MEKNDELTNMFRGKLQGAEMEVRADFWNRLSQDLQEAAPRSRKLALFPPKARWAAAATIAVLLGIASVPYLTQSPVQTSEEVSARRVSDDLQAANAATNTQTSIQEPYAANIVPASSAYTFPANFQQASIGEEEEDEDVFQMTIQITSQVYTSYPSAGYVAASNASEMYSEEETVASVAPTEEKRLSKWAWKVGVGSSLPKGDYRMPVSVGIAVERSLNKSLSVEAGLQYAHYPTKEAKDVQTLSVPVRVNAVLASVGNTDIYAMGGAMAEKVLGHGFTDDPVQLSAMAGVGVRCRLNDRLAVYAEPSVSYHFDNDGQTRYLQNERKLGVGVQCGVRMAF